MKKQYDGIKLFEVNHKGYKGYANKACPLLTPKDFDKGIKAIKNAMSFKIEPQPPLYIMSPKMYDEMMRKLEKNFNLKRR